jgi:hypothetical protein
LLSFSHSPSESYKLAFIETENRPGGQAFMAVLEAIFLNEPIQFVAFTPAYLIQFRSLHSYRFLMAER